MWVDTKGEDGPQCRHDTPEGALLAQPPPHLSCKSLFYTLHSISNSTSIRVTCGIHEYFKSSTTTTLPEGAVHVQIVGECSKDACGICPKKSVGGRLAGLTLLT